MNDVKTAQPESNVVDVIIVGGGQAGLSTSYYLQQEGVSHLVIEKGEVMNAWKHKRWDSFSLVTPNWQCKLPGHAYEGSDPHGFMVKDEIIDYLNEFEQKLNAPILSHTSVVNITQAEDSVFKVETNKGIYFASQVVVAAGGYHEPIIPRMAERIPDSIYQIHSEEYKNNKQLPEGNVLVVGSGQSGAQIAEDLHLSGRKVYLATGDAPRCARFYRGKDVVDWLAEMKYYDMPVSEHPLREGVRDNTNHYVTGRDGGRDIDLRKFATEGMELFGLMHNFNNDQFEFLPNLKANLDNADDVYNNINKRIDAYIEKNSIDAPEQQSYQAMWQPEKERTHVDLNASGITSIVWCIGFRPNFQWLNMPVFDGKGMPMHTRGVTSQSGVFFVGLPWLYTWGSGRFSGIASDAEFIVKEIKQNLHYLLNQKQIPA
ncbi:MSMEG_0569 family flavin-dependent oxidoreductase [Alteromonas sp. 5E99-2]|uniref:MSMEG_0569 family flavin-dependent oxidoreductase n=1 Tax=Alteromonas sp. 5E99-2 TaxID=2817683 RepID=UPI001A97E5CB|nr:MSMEG_0569 family flavin-dependent oxidoreductase [Alteromonas sp. 5E99-2]MBO1255505.1 MSMEG_0569 family flavin-dependent oxidoreductase [Alteromonas sp. 5E99-2]